MSRITEPPTAFEKMRSQRRHMARRRGIQAFEQLKAEARALGYDDTEECAHQLRRIDAGKPVSAKPKLRWWSPIAAAFGVEAHLER